jgi:hypothetical protein
MTQFDFDNIDEANTSGNALGLMLELQRDALHSSHKGPTRPTYAVPGIVWIQDGANPWKINFFDGVNDLVIGTIDPITHILTNSNNMVSDIFSGNGILTNFILSSTPLSINHVSAFESGIRQYPGIDFTLSGNTLIFITAPLSITNNILAVYTT